MEESYFDGGLLDYIGISIAMWLVSIITLGIGVPWAVCIFERWKARHTVICGRRLKFVGTGGGLFGHYIKWFLLTIITFGIYGFWLYIKMEQWKSKNTVFDTHS